MRRENHRPAERAGRGSLGEHLQKQLEKRRNSGESLVVSELAFSRGPARGASCGESPKRNPGAWPKVTRRDDQISSRGNTSLVCEGQKVVAESGGVGEPPGNRDRSAVWP